MTSLKSRFILCFLAFFLIILTLSSFLLLSSSVLANSTSANNVSVTVPVSCSFSATVDTAHSATIFSGIYQENIGTTTFSTFCNDSGGYSIYAIGYSNNEFGNTKLLATVNNVLNPSHDITTNTNVSGATSSWSMKLIPVSGATAPTIESDASGSFSNYHAVPNIYTKVATLSSNTNAIAGSSVKSTYATYISSDQPAGTYQGKVKYTMVHPATSVPNEPKNCAANRICYWPNGNGEVADSMGDQRIYYLDGSGTYIGPDVYVPLWPSNFKRPGYGFAGWSTTYDYSDPDGFYGSMEVIDMGNRNRLSLYAIWIKSTGYLQDWNGCNLLTIATNSQTAYYPVTADLSSVTALTDRRDGETYAVARLADGNCWMVENLRLDHTAELTSENTNNPSLPLTNNIQTGAKSNFLSSPTNNPEDWCDTNILHDGCYNQSQIDTKNTTQTIDNFTTTDYVATGNIYSLGNYYNWYSATAGRGTASTTSANPGTSGDLCPHGWRLPTSWIQGSYPKGDAGTLGAAVGGGEMNNPQFGQYNTNSPARVFFQFPYNFVFTDTNGGRYWTKSASGPYAAVTMTMWNNGVDSSSKLNYLTFYPADTAPKQAGASVRCLIKP